VPLVGLNLSVAYYPQFSRGYHYDDFASVFLIVAAMHRAVVVLGAVGSAFNGWRAIATYVFMALAALMALLLPKPAPRSTISYLQSIWPASEERELYRELAAYRSLPFEIGIAAQRELGPYLSARPRYVSIHSASPEGIDTRRLDTRRLKPG